MKREIPIEHIIRLDKSVVPEDKNDREYAEQVLSEEPDIWKVVIDGTFGDSEIPTTIEVSNIPLVPVEEFISNWGEELKYPDRWVLERVAEVDIGKEIPLFPNEKEVYYPDTGLDPSSEIWVGELIEINTFSLREFLLDHDEYHVVAQELKERNQRLRELDEEYTLEGAHKIAVEEELIKEDVSMLAFIHGVGNKEGKVVDDELKKEWVDEHYGTTVVIDDVLIPFDAGYGEPTHDMIEVSLSLERGTTVTNCATVPEGSSAVNEYQAYELTGGDPGNLRQYFAKSKEELIQGIEDSCDRISDALRQNLSEFEPDEGGRIRYSWYKNEIDGEIVAMSLEEARKINSEE